MDCPGGTQKCWRLAMYGHRAGRASRIGLLHFFAFADFSSLVSLLFQLLLLIPSSLGMGLVLPTLTFPPFSRYCFIRSSSVFFLGICFIVVTLSFTSLFQADLDYWFILPMSADTGIGNDYTGSMTHCYENGPAHSGRVLPKGRQMPRIPPFSVLHMLCGCRFPC